MSATSSTAPSVPRTGHRPTISWGEACDRAWQAGAALAAARPAESVPLAQAGGRVLADPLRALVDVPHFESSAMDGWAVAGAAPWRLVHAHSPNGICHGEATPILTGALMPPGADAVLRSESGLVAAGADGVRRLVPAPGTAPGEPWPGQHVRSAATEAYEGELLVPAGTLLNPVHLALAAGAGHDALPIRPRVRVALLRTGDEVIDAGIPAPGRVRDSFGPALPGVLAGLGAEVVDSRHVADDARSTALALETLAAARAELVITTGGTGRSDADHLRPALRAAGAEFLVDGIDVRPGGPAFLARLPHGPLVVGLPGNPLAALMVVVGLVQPLLRAVLGCPEPEPESSDAGPTMVRLAEPCDAGPTTVRLAETRDAGPTMVRLAESCDAGPTTVRLAESIEGARCGTLLRPFRFAPSHPSARQDGLDERVAVPTRWHGSAMLRGLAEADGILVVPGAGARAGERIGWLPLPW